MENLSQPKLIPVKIRYYSGDNTWTFEPSIEGSSRISFKSDDVRIKRLLRRIRAKDSITAPKSKKGVTYQTMIDDIKNKSLSSIYVWKSRCPRTLELISALMEE